MMFSMTWENANNLYKFAKTYCYKADIRPTFRLIMCRTDGCSLFATMCNEHFACKITIPISDGDVDCNADMFLAPPPKPFKKTDGKVCIIDTDSTTEYKTANGSVILAKPSDYERKPFRFETVTQNEPKFSIWIDPKVLMNALTVFADTKPIQLDFVGVRTGVYLSKGDAKAIVLPMNPPKGEGV